MQEGEAAGDEVLGVAGMALLLSVATDPGEMGVLHASGMLSSKLVDSPSPVLSPPVPHKAP